NAGEKLYIKADVDERGYFGSASALVEGDEFQYTHMTATFNAPHYKSAAGAISTPLSAKNYFGDKIAVINFSFFCPQSRFYTHPLCK
ncbi:MAG TPA: hypothetical protein PK230_03905, partial [Chitinophagales bacterium]|nr:hypothetical protein [Chitinophagales bacterium]